MKIRTLGIAVIAVVALAVIGVAILSGRVDSLRPRIQAELQQKLDRPVSIQHIGLNLLPLELKIENFSIGEAAGFPQQRPFATANSVFVSVGLFSLISGSPEVKDLTLDKPQIELIRNAAGTWNFSSLGKGGSSGSSNTKLSLDLLKITDGQIGYTDQLNHQDRSVYDHIDLKLSDFAPGKVFGLNLGVHFPGVGKQMLEFNGKAGPIDVATENAVPPVNGHLSIDQVSLAGFNRFASGTFPPDTNATASGEADINSLADVLGCKGNLRLDDMTLKGAKMGYPVTVAYNVEDDLKQKKLLIRSGVMQLGTTAFSLSGDVTTATTPAILNVNLKTDQSSITELAKLAGGFGYGANPVYNVAGKISANITAKGPASEPQLSGTLRAQGLSASGGEIKQPVSIPEIDLNLSPDSITSNTFNATSGSTTLAVAFTLLKYSTVNRSIDASVKTGGANVAELLNIAKTYGIEAAQGMSGDGKLTLDLHVSGPLANASTLNYSGTANVSNTTLAMPSLKKPLTIASANATFSQNSVSLENLAASLGGTTVRGTLSAKNFAAPQMAFNLNADKIDTGELQNITTTPPAKKGTANAAKADSPSLLMVTTGSGTLAAGMIKANDILLRDVSTKVQLNKGLIELSPFSAEVFGGKANGTLTTDMRPATPDASVKMKFAGVDANLLLSAVSPMKDRVSGTLAADTNLKFALVQSNDLARTLNGVLSFNLSNGVIRNIDILNEVSKIGKLAGGRDSANGGTTVKKFGGTLNIVNGVANTQDLAGELSQGSIAAKGALNLATQDVNMHLIAALGSSTAGGQPAGGLLNTVLATSKGLLMIPILVTGNLAHPSVAPDLEEMAKLKLSNLGGAKGAVGSVLGGLLGGSTQDGKTKKNANPLGSILDQFSKPKK